MVPVPTNPATVGTLMKGLPVAEGLKLVDTVLNHFQTMKRIEAEYKYQKAQLRYQYELESRKLDMQMKVFEKMAKQQHRHFEIGYKERKKLLQKMDKLIDASIANPYGPYGVLLQSLLEQYGQNIKQFVGVYSQAEQISFQGEA